MTCIETFATLRIFSDTMDPEEIERILEIDGTEKVPIDPKSPYKPRREAHYWCWSTEGRVNSTESAQHIKAIVTLLKDKSKKIADLRASDCKIDICNYWVSSGQGGPSMDAATMQSLGELGLDIWWDIYFNRESET